MLLVAILQKIKYIPTARERLHDLALFKFTFDTLDYDAKILLQSSVRTSLSKKLYCYRFLIVSSCSRSKCRVHRRVSSISLGVQDVFHSISTTTWSCLWHKWELLLDTLSGFAHRYRFQLGFASKLLRFEHVHGKMHQGVKNRNLWLWSSHE